MTYTTPESAIRFQLKAAFARSFVQGIELRELTIPPLHAVKSAPIDYDTLKNQALVVGSDVVSFVKGVSAEARQDITNSTLLAQLVARKKVPDLTRIYDWYQEYFNVLTNVGWVIQDQGFTQYSASCDKVEIHSAILNVAEMLLGPGVAALAIIKSALDALKSTAINSPWIALFDRESRHANAAKFQITTAQTDQNDELVVSLTTFGLQAETTVTQVLFFKFQSSQATLKKYFGVVSVDSALLSSVRQAITDKLSALTSDCIKQVPDLG